MPALEGGVGFADHTSRNTMQKKPTARFVAALCTLLGTLVLAQAASADTINLAWDPNPEPEVIGYIVHVGTHELVV